MIQQLEYVTIQSLPHPYPFIGKFTFEVFLIFNLRKLENRGFIISAMKSQTSCFIGDRLRDLKTTRPSQTDKCGV